MAETITVEEARRLAHEQKLRTDPEYRMSYAAWCVERDAMRARIRERRRGRIGCMLNGWVACRLPMPRVFLLGPRWRRFLVEGTKHDYDFADDVRERVLEEVRPGVVAMWSDPRERVL
jgi:hypothetical protein